MAAPTAADVRAEIEGYGVTTTVLSDAWVERCRDYEIIPFVKRITRMEFTDAETEVTEYYNGTGQAILILNRKPVNEIVSIENVGAAVVTNFAGSVELIGAEGIIKMKTNYSEGIYSAYFAKGDKNLKITYKYGYADYPNDVKQAIVLMVAAKALAIIGARTGGGSLQVQNHGRNYGTHGKYTDIRKEFVNSANTLLEKYTNHVVGS